MKKINLLFIVFGLSFLMSLFSCSSDDGGNSNTNGSVNTGELKLFLLDTAKVNTISPTGTNEKTIVNRLFNLNSYISGMAISPDGSKIVYSESQTTGVYPNLVHSKEIRIANNDGSDDRSLFSSTSNEVNFGGIKVSTDKVYFMTYNYTANTKTINTVNLDGTGLQSDPAYYFIEDISTDGKYFTVPVSDNQTDFLARIMDKTGDNGAGSLYHAETFPLTAEKLTSGIFTNDGKKVIYAYVEGSDVKIRSLDIATKTAQTVSIIQNVNLEFFNLSMSMASDSNRGVITIADYNANTPSKSYVFNLATTTVTSTFSNNDDNIFDVYAY